MWTSIWRNSFPREQPVDTDALGYECTQHLQGTTHVAVLRLDTRAQGWNYTCKLGKY